MLDVSFGASQAHMFRRGTASALEGLDFNPNLINLHMGWSHGSSMLSVYRRTVSLNKWDKLFFHDVLVSNKIHDL